MTSMSSAGSPTLPYLSNQRAKSVELPTHWVCDVLGNLHYSDSLCIRSGLSTEAIGLVSNHPAGISSFTSSNSNDAPESQVLLQQFW